MGKHRAPDSDEPTGEPSDDYSPPEDFGDAGGSREPEDFPADLPQDTGSIPEPRYPDRPSDFPDDFPDRPGFFDFDEPSDEHRDHPGDYSHPEQPEQDLRPAARPSSIRRMTFPTSRAAARGRRLRHRRRIPAAIEREVTGAAVTATTAGGAVSASE
jgi:hypothetical protein